MNQGSRLTLATNARVRAGLRGRPPVDVGRPVDELEVAGALGITVARAVRGARVGEGAGAAVEVHGHEVEGAIEAATARQGSVNVAWKYPTYFWDTHGRFDTSTSKVNSLPSRVKPWYLLSSASR